MNGSYCQLNLATSSKIMLQDFMKQFRGRGRLIHAKQYHCTVMYSRVHVEPIKINTPISAKAIGYDIFDDNLLVIRLHCPQATSIFNELVSNGATYDFPSYVPHITVAANWKGQVPELVPKNIIWFDSYDYEDLDVTAIY